MHIRPQPLTRPPPHPSINITSTPSQAFPQGVLTNAYGHGALFRSSITKVVEKIRIVTARAKYKLETRVTTSHAAKDDQNDAFGPLKGEIAVGQPWHVMAF